jgi:secondary thiamine-phosphate synthase enzyme
VYQAQHRLTFETRGRGFTDITRAVAGWLGSIGAGDGLVTLFLRHTSASLTIQENADPDVLRDLLDALDRLAPRDAGYRHDVEGPDDMPAHITSMLTSTSLSAPAGWCSAPGRPSTSSSTATARTAASWCCTMSGCKGSDSYGRLASR